MTRREHAAVELSAKLRDRGYDSAEVEAELERLAAAGLQSDFRFAESYVSARLARGDGPLRLRAALRERGVDSELIETLLQAHAGDWEQRAREAAAKRFGSRPPRDWDERARRARFLQGRGFPADVVRRVTEFEEVED